MTNIDRFVHGAQLGNIIRLSVEMIDMNKKSK